MPFSPITASQVTTAPVGPLTSGNVAGQLAELAGAITTTTSRLVDAKACANAGTVTFAMPGDGLWFCEVYAAAQIQPTGEPGDPFPADLQSTANDAATGTDTVFTGPPTTVDVYGGPGVSGGAVHYSAWTSTGTLEVGCTALWNDHAVTPPGFPATAWTVTCTAVWMRAAQADEEQ